MDYYHLWDRFDHHPLIGCLMDHFLGAFSRQPEQPELESLAGDRGGDRIIELQVSRRQVVGRQKE